MNQGAIAIYPAHSARNKCGANRAEIIFCRYHVAFAPLHHSAELKKAHHRVRLFCARGMELFKTTCGHLKLVFVDIALLIQQRDHSEEIAL